MYTERRILDTLLIVTFMAGLILPLLLTNNQDTSSYEKRALASFPTLKWDQKSLVEFRSQFEAFFNDHFGFRDDLVRVYNLLGVTLKSSSNKNVLVGKDGWLFYISPTDGNTLEDHMGNDRLTPEQLQSWKIVLEAQYTWLKQQGIKYVFVIAPDKQSIYGEYLPSRIHQTGKQTRLDQLSEYMRDSQVPVLDLRSPLLQAKAEGLLYYKTDTHWNNFGASVAQYEIMRYISEYFPDIHPTDYDYSDFALAESSGDMARMLNLSSELQEMTPQIKKALPECNKQLLDTKPIRTTFSTDCRANAPTALIFRDSFFTALQPYISQYFSNSVYVWGQPNFKELEKYVGSGAPQVVIEERVERYLASVPALPVPGDKAYDAFFGTRFQMGQVVYQLGEHHPKVLSARHRLSINRTEQGYLLIPQGANPFFLLPQFSIDREMQYLLRIDLNVSQETALQVFFATLQMPRYDQEHSISVQLRAGDNRLYFLLDSVNLRGRIRVNLGSAQGSYLLKSLELRAVQR